MFKDLINSHYIFSTAGQYLLSCKSPAISEELLKVILKIISFYIIPNLYYK